MSYDYEEAGRRMESKIAHIKAKQALPGELVNLIEDVARMQLSARQQASVSLSEDLACASGEDVIRGVPLVARDAFPHDREQARNLLDQVFGLIGQGDMPMQKGAALLAEAVQKSELVPDELFDAYFSENTTFFEKWSQVTPEAPQLTRFLAAAALGPSIEVAAELLAERLPEVTTWHNGSCPICGSLPLISSLRQREGFRHMTCSFCRHEFRVRRIACPVCGEDDQKKLTFFTVEQEPGFRVDVCQTCKAYIKTIDFRALDRVPLPVLDDLDSLVLDYVAMDQGYRRGTLSAWGF